MADLKKSSETLPRRGFFSDDFDNLFEGFFRPMTRFPRDENGSMMPAVDVIDEDNQFVVKAELPGVKREDIDVSINNGVLTINAERKMEEESKDEKGRVIRRESRYGQYLRTMTLDNSVDVKNVKADYTDGILKLVLPKAEEAKPQKIEVAVK
ncbi:MAG: Hsp20/alpha crystallin family protein [Gammaproteobacteria bacterium]|jgi:HSP20 family protein